MSQEIKPINRRIAGYRKLAGYTQEQAAELLGIKRNTYARIEHHGNPSPKLIEQLSKLYKIPVQNFFSDQPLNFQPEPEPYKPNVLNQPNLFNTSDVLPLSVTEANLIRILRALPKENSDATINFVNGLYHNRNKK